MAARLDLQIVGQPEKIRDMVINFIEPYKGKFRILYMDNFYNSVALCKELLT